MVLVLGFVLLVPTAAGNHNLGHDVERQTADLAGQGVERPLKSAWTGVGRMAQMLPVQEPRVEAFPSPEEVFWLVWDQLPEDGPCDAPELRDPCNTCTPRTYDKPDGGDNDPVKLTALDPQGGAVALWIAVFPWLQNEGVPWVTDSRAAGIEAGVHECPHSGS